MDYIVDINNWTDLFVTQIFGKTQYSINEVDELKNAYIQLRTKYKKNVIDKLTIDFLSENNEVIAFFKDKDITHKEISSIFDFYNHANEILNSKEIEHAVTNSIQTKDITEIKDFKIRQMYETGILDFVEFKKYFKSDVAFCEVKEALGWYIAYIESADYDLDSIIVKNEDGQLDRKSTLFNVMKDINEKSLTNTPPFKIENNEIRFNPAGSSEVDVLMWNENEQKIIGMSATRDRTNLIEGNQFIRHNMILNAWSTVFDDYKRQKRIPNNFKLSSTDIRNVMHDYGWQNKFSAKNVLKLIDLDSDVIQSIETHHFAFARHLSYVRQSIKIKTGQNFHENGLEITKDEIAAIQDNYKDKVKFYFFGEVYNKSALPELNGGLLKRAYLDNFNNIMSFSMKKEAARSFMDGLEIRFNNVPVVNSMDYYAEQAICLLFTSNKTNFKVFSDFFAEGNSYKEERGMLFKSASIFLEEINELKVLNDENIIKTIENNFKTLTDNQKETIFNQLKDLSLFDNLKRNADGIRKAPSEVNQFLENLYSQSKACESNLKYSQEKSKNELMMDYLKSKGIQIDPNDFQNFVKNVDNKSEISTNNKKRINLE